MSRQQPIVNLISTNHACQPYSVGRVIIIIIIIIE